MTSVTLREQLAAVAAILLVASGALPAQGPRSSAPTVGAATATDADFKVAFIGDSDDEANFQAVVGLIEAEGAELVLHQGDFSYSSGPTTAWTDAIDSTLGADFPYLGSPGNHDVWSEYVPFFRARLTAMGLDPDLLPASDTLGNYTAAYRVDDPATTGIDVCVGPDRNFVFVSGLGGRGMRDQERCLPATFPYGCTNEWASIYSATQTPGGAEEFGALFVTFHVDGDPHKAHAYFKTTGGTIVDEFDIRADGSAAATTTTITADTPDPSLNTEAVTVSYTVSAPAGGVPTGTVTVSDGVDSCVGSVAAGSCQMTVTTVGARTIVTTYAGDATFAASASAGVAHQVHATTTKATPTLPPAPRLARPIRSRRRTRRRRLPPTR